MLLAPSKHPHRLNENEQGTRYLFGKPYHWARNEAGGLTLLPGPDPIQEMEEGVEMKATEATGEGVHAVVIKAEPKGGKQS